MRITKTRPAAGIAVGFLVLLYVLRVARVVPYIVVGLFLWLAMLKSGTAAALAGILIAFAVPMHLPGCECSSPLRETERRLHPWVVLLVVPLFAFFNAGVAIDSGGLGSLWTPASLGILGGLYIGKQMGVFGAAVLAVRLGIGALPRGVTWSQVYGAALLAGIGFTMSLFVAALAFPDAALVASAKLAILLGSLLSAVTGVCIIFLSTRTRQGTMRITGQLQGSD